MTIKIASAADLHLDDTRTGGWDAKAGIHSSWVESFKQLNTIIDICNAEGVDILVLAGDVYSTGNPKPEAVALTNDAFKRAKFKTIITGGNHEHQGIVANHRNPLEAYLKDQPWCYAVSTEPEVVDFNGFAFALLPWLKVAGVSQQEIANVNLRDTIMRLGDEVGSRESFFSAHIVVDECTFDSGRRGAELQQTTSVLEASVPSAVIDEGPWLAARLGHIHLRQELSAKTGYEGSIYKTSFGERNQDKAFSITEYTESGLAIRTEHKLAVRQLIQADLSLDGGEMASEVVKKVNEGDIVKFIIDHGEEPIGFEKAKRKLEKMGISLSVYTKPKVREHQSGRVSGAKLDSSPVDAFRIYMDRAAVPATRQKSLMETFQDIISDADDSSEITLDDIRNAEQAAA